MATNNCYLLPNNEQAAEEKRRVILEKIDEEQIEPTEWDLRKKPATWFDYQYRVNNILIVVISP